MRGRPKIEIKKVTRSFTTDKDLYDTALQLSKDKKTSLSSIIRETLHNFVNENK